jgi:hypothetical protein
MKKMIFIILTAVFYLFAANKYQYAEVKVSGRKTLNFYKLIILTSTELLSEKAENL